MVGFLVLALLTATVLVSIFSCHPVNGYWDRTVPATCIDSRAFYLGNAIANILTDVIILTLPVQMVWHLQTPRSQKIALTFIFGLGGFVVIVSSIRIAFIIQVGPDFTWDYTNPIIWTDIETSIAVICACLPTLRPVAQYAVGALNSIRLRSKGSTSESSQELGPTPADASYVGPSRVKKDYSQFQRLEERREVTLPVNAV